MVLPEDNVISDTGVAARFDKIPIPPQITTRDADAKRCASSLVGGDCSGTDRGGTDKQFRNPAVVDAGGFNFFIRWRSPSPKSPRVVADNQSLAPIQQRFRAQFRLGMVCLQSESQLAGPLAIAPRERRQPVLLAD